MQFILIISKEVEFGVCIYYKELLPVRVVSLPYFKEALFLEMTDSYKKIIVSVIYRFSSQNISKFDSFLSNFEQLLRDITKCKKTVSVITGDFNARSSSWWFEDINTSERTKSYSLSSSNGFLQLINEPTHTQTNSSSSIDLIFTDQPNLSVNSGVHASLHQNCHHQIVHTKFSRNISYPHHASVLYRITKRQIQKKLGKP